MTSVSEFRAMLRSGFDRKTLRDEGATRFRGAEGHRGCSVGLDLERSLRELSFDRCKRVGSQWYWCYYCPDGTRSIVIRSSLALPSLISSPCNCSSPRPRNRGNSWHHLTTFQRGSPRRSNCLIVQLLGESDNLQTMLRPFPSRFSEPRD